MSESGQTGPEWAAASRPLPTIPNEIFLEIFSYIQPSIEMEPTECTEILSQLSLVCSFFCTTLRPRLFSKLELNARDERTNPSSAAFCRALLRDDASAQLLAAHIRICKIYSWPSGDPEGSILWIKADLIMMYRLALRQVPNIEILLVSYSSFDSGIWEVVGGFSKLKILRVFNVSTSSDVSAKEVEHITRLRLSSFIILRSQVSTLSRILNPSALVEFSGDPGSLDALLATGSTSTLKTLAISRHIEVRSLINILHKVPSVRSLSIPLCTVGDHDITLQESSTLLPNLRSLTCPLPLMTLLAPGRSLTRVSIMGAGSNPPLNLDTILGTHEPNNTIVELSIPPIVADETPTAGRFPCLRKLILRHIYHPQIPAVELKSLIISACNKWAGNLSVQELDIPMDLYSLAESLPMDLALQHAVLTESLSQTFPALLQFRLGEYAVWERFAVGDSWRVLVSAKYRARLIARLEAGDPGVVDHDGYLRRSRARNRS